VISVKKIALICNSGNPDLFEYFISKGKIKDENIVEKVHFYTNSKKISEVDFPCKISCFSRQSAGDKYLFFDFLWAFVLFFQFLFKGIRIVVFDTAHIANVPISILCKIFGIRVVLTIHDWNPHEGDNYKKVVLYNWFCREILADEFIVFSKIDYHKKKVHCLTLSGFKEKFLEKDKADSYLFFGRIEPYKGLGSLVKIVQIANERNIPIKFIIAGKGHDPNLKTLSRFDNVKIINRFIADDEIANLFATAKGCLVPYDTATQSGVIICSYSFNTPVISFDVGNLSEYIVDGSTGYLVAPKDIEEFVKCIQKMDSCYENMSNFIKTEFISKYSVEAMQKQYVELFKNL
jgi:glycosyltransferase involved in cell wall biosynthesis